MDIITVKDLKKHFILSGGISEFLLRRKPKIVHAVDGVSFNINEGETLSLVGESGSGKTTTGRLLVKLEEPTEGKILFEGRDITHVKGEELRRLRREFQIIFQDPYASLNPRMKVGEAILDPLVIHRIVKNEKEGRDQALKMLEEVELVPSEFFYNAYSHQLSGGQRQRVAIARAMILHPKFIVADEPVSMIDVSLRAAILRLLLKFKNELNQSMLFISHDIATAAVISDRIAVMYLGKMMEIGTTKQILENPLHPYTRALIEAIPSIKRRPAKKISIKGEIADPINPPKGCRFHPRCPYTKDICKGQEPMLKEVEKDHFVACWLY